jgi:hypothetical protein
MVHQLMVVTIHVVDPEYDRVLATDAALAYYQSPLLLAAQHYPMLATSG